MSTRFVWRAAILAAFAGGAARVHAGSCTIDGGPAVIVMTDVDEAPNCIHEPENKGGQGEIWKGPPPGPGAPLGTLTKAGTTFNSGDWWVGATDDFSGDAQCDIVWVRFDCTLHEKKLTLTATSAEGHVVVPTVEPTVSVPAAFQLIGSGDFVCEPESECPAPDPVDGAPDLVWWDPVGRNLHFWGSDGSGAFPNTPAGFRRQLPGPLPSWMPVAVADLDGTGFPEIVWRNESSGNLVYWGIGIDPGTGELVHSTGGFLSPAAPTDANWSLRGAGDLNGDGKDDLLFQNDCSDSGVAWYMDGPVRSMGGFLEPSVFPPHAAVCLTGTHWKMYGPR